jgi:signal transduction histidine kinase
MERYGSAAASREAQTPTLVVAGAAGAVLCGLSVAVVWSGTDSSHPGLAALGRALMVAVPIAAGCFAHHRRPSERFGLVLIAAGFAWFLTTLAESDDELLYSVGRVAGWVAEAGLVYLVLSFPTGRLTGRTDRALVWAAALIVATLYLPTAFISESYPVPAPYTSCDAACPENAFFMLDSEPALVDAVVRPLREALTIVLFLAVTARLAQRVRHATPLMRRTLSPVLVVAIARLLVLAGAVALRGVAPESPVVDVLTWLVALGLPAIAASFVMGLLRWRLFVADSLERLSVRLRSSPGAGELRSALANALDDPSLRLAYWVQTNGGGWVDAEGRSVELPAGGSGQLVSEVREGERRIGAIVYDEGLRDQGELVDAAASYARIALENQRLAAKVQSSLREVRASRARIAATADRERRRIERDLHDGAQQRLVALRIKLELAEDLVRDDQEQGLVKLHALGEEVEATLDEIRSLAHGVYPSLLADRGLADALRSVAVRAPIHASVEPDGIGRYPQDVESAVYFCCLEALQNASKHAHGATLITITLAQDDALRFEVRDDGAGFDTGAPPSGAGVTNMRDRLVAVGGSVTITSAPGHGAVVSGTVPLGGASGNGV